MVAASSSRSSKRGPRTPGLESAGPSQPRPSKRAKVSQPAASNPKKPSKASEKEAIKRHKAIEKAIEKAMKEASRREVAPTAGESSTCQPVLVPQGTTAPDQCPPPLPDLLMWKRPPPPGRESMTGCLDLSLSLPPHLLDHKGNSLPFQTPKGFKQWPPPQPRHLLCLKQGRIQS